MTPTFETIENKFFIGMTKQMSLVENKTFHLFSSFMPRHREIPNAVAGNIYDLKVYPEDYFKNFSPTKTFDKWALVEVDRLGEIPEGMEEFSLEGGKYAVFKHRGNLKDNSPFEYIYGQWLPNSGYQLDNRPHFDIMSPKSKNDDANAEQEIWIPIK